MYKFAVQQYYRHTRGLLHTQRQAAAAADKRQTAGEQNQEEIAPKDGSKELQMPVGKSDIKQTEKVKEGPARVSVAQPAPVEKSSAALTESKTNGHLVFQVHKRLVWLVCLYVCLNEKKRMSTD